MNFDLAPDQQAIKTQAREFAARELAPFAADWDERAVFPRGVFAKLAALRWTGILCPPEAGGAGYDALTTALVYEELAKGCLATTFSLVVHNNNTFGIYRGGTPEQRARWVGDLVAARKLCAFALTEPGAGSDAAAIATTATLAGDHYVLNGVKNWVTNGGEADVYQVMAKTAPERGAAGISTLVVEKGTPGLHFGEPDVKMAGNNMPTCTVYFEGCRVPRANLLGNEGDGLKLALRGIDVARVFVGALSTGLAEAALEAAVSYAKERRAFGGPIARLEGLQFALADMATAIAAGRLLTYQAAYLFDQGASFTQAAAMAKKFTADAAMAITTRAVQLFGAYGYLRGNPVERSMRLAKMTQLIDGTSEIQQVVIARHMLG